MQLLPILLNRPPVKVYGDAASWLKAEHGVDLAQRLADDRAKAEAAKSEQKK
jgi:hypothetical protein